MECRPWQRRSQDDHTQMTLQVVGDRAPRWLSKHPRAVEMRHLPSWGHQLDARDLRAIKPTASSQ